MHKNPALLEKPGRFCEPESLYGKDCLGIGVVATLKVDILSNPCRTQHSQVCAPYFQAVSVTHFSHLSGLWSHLNLWLLRFLFFLSFSGIHGSGTEWCVLWKGDRIHLCKYWALVLIISTSFILSRTFSPSQIVWACWPTHHSSSQRIAHCVSSGSLWPEGATWGGRCQFVGSLAPRPGLDFDLKCSLDLSRAHSASRRVCISFLAVGDPSLTFTSFSQLSSVPGDCFGSLRPLSSSTGCPGGKSGLLLARVLHISPRLCSHRLRWTSLQVGGY